MPQFVSEGAETLRETPTPDSTVELVVRVDESALDDIERWAVDHGGEILDALSHGLVELSLPESAVAALCDLEYVSSVERANENIGVLDEGN